MKFLIKIYRFDKRCSSGKRLFGEYSYDRKNPEEMEKEVAEFRKFGYPKSKFEIVVEAICGYAHLDHIKHEHGNAVYNLQGYNLCENCYIMVRNAVMEYDRAQTEYYSKKSKEYIEKNR